jgi:formamidopyrimidine-DNA glycosylase
MPELPEVETIVRELSPSLAGRRISDVRVFRNDALGDRPPGEFREALVGRTFERVNRRGKFLVFHLRPRRFLIGHLRMTGKFVLSGPLEAPHPHHRVWFGLDGKAMMIFQDMRCFGTLRVVDSLLASPSLAKLGVEPLSRGFTPEWLAGALAASKAPLKHWLMDQSKVAGLGNIYAAEILFQAGLSPSRPARRIGVEEAARLHGATRKVLRKAIRKNGTTISDFRRVDEKTGEFQGSLQVYGRAGKPCSSCRTPIATIRQQQRSTFFCPSCQA